MAQGLSRHARTHQLEKKNSEGKQVSSQSINLCISYERARMMIPTQCTHASQSHTFTHPKNMGFFVHLGCSLIFTLFGDVIHIHFVYGASVHADRRMTLRIPRPSAIWFGVNSIETEIGTAQRAPKVKDILWQLHLQPSLFPERGCRCAEDLTTCVRGQVHHTLPMRGRDWDRILL